jgi:hypothetical protein
MNAKNQQIILKNLNAMGKSEQSNMIHWHGGMAGLLSQKAMT